MRVCHSQPKTLTGVERYPCEVVLCHLHQRGEEGRGGGGGGGCLKKKKKALGHSLGQCVLREYVLAVAVPHMSAVSVS